MAHLIACGAMSHAPQLMLDPDYWHLLRNRESENLPEKPGLEKWTMELKREKWNGCRAAIARLRDRVEAARPDAIVVIGDDQHENLIEDNMPPFSVYIGKEAEASTSLRYLNESTAENRARYPIADAMARALIDGLMDEGFDPAYSYKTRYPGGLGHAFARVLKFLNPTAAVPVIPVMINTYYPPVPSAQRCVLFGRTLARLIGRFPGNERVVIVGSGGLSHTKIDEELDYEFIAALESNDLDSMAAIPAHLLVDGTSEIRNWIVTAAAANAPGRMIDYVPLYRTRTGVGCAMGFAWWELSETTGLKRQTVSDMS